MTQHRPARCGHRQQGTPAIEGCAGAGIDPAILARGILTVGDPGVAIGTRWPCGGGTGRAFWDRNAVSDPELQKGAVLRGWRCCVSELRGPFDSLGNIRCGLDSAVAAVT